MSPTFVLITGANRGIGRGLLELYLAKPNHTVIAANRDPKDPTSTELLNLPTAQGTTAKVVKLDMASPTDAEEAARILKSEGIEHIDILIANAGIGLKWPKLEELLVDDLRTHFETNVLGFVRVYQAFFTFMKAAKDPKNAGHYPNAAYGPTKVVQHWFTRTVSIQEPWLTAVTIDPGFVQTNIGNRAANLLDLEKASITVEESAGGMLSVIDASTNKTHSGTLWKWTGKEEPW
ncbi:hypothetical protein BJY04DRAFT_216285 [Aspergillus karnatakaensis]|uniref:uncharacterized protein n=1 Tax=Aspergillus karnatakaensis TaxID=1810916 RepID=UPI003CCDB5FC